jgi:ABC-2 type transport system ATP-binding protein
VTIDDKPYAEHPNPGRLVGVMLDAAAQHPGRTGIETLRLTARMLGLPGSRATEMLEQVGLGDAAQRRVGNYSLGMRQRLGIGTALMGDPAVLILDEPANGMDPEGIRWMRLLLHDFAGRGGTVLLSSHLLAEVQATVDRLVVIGAGRIVADDSLASLLAGQGTTVRGLDPNGLEAALRGAGLDTSVGANGALHVQASVEQVGRTAAASHQVLLELREHDSAGLEELFFQLTSTVTASAA